MQFVWHISSTITFGFISLNPQDFLICINLQMSSTLLKFEEFILFTLTEIAFYLKLRNLTFLLVCLTRNIGISESNQTIPHSTRKSNAMTIIFYVLTEIDSVEGQFTMREMIRFTERNYFPHETETIFIEIFLHKYQTYDSWCNLLSTLSNKRFRNNECTFY